MSSTMRKGLIAIGVVVVVGGVAAVLYSKSNRAGQWFQDGGGDPRVGHREGPGHRGDSAQAEIAVKSKISGIVKTLTSGRLATRCGPAIRCSRSCPTPRRSS